MPWQGHKLLWLIQQQGTRKKRLLEVLDISKPTLNSYICNDTSPNINTVEKLADFYNVPVSHFLRF